VECPLRLSALTNWEAIWTVKVALSLDFRPAAVTCTRISIFQMLQPNSTNGVSCSYAMLLFLPSHVALVGSLVGRGVKRKKGRGKKKKEKTKKGKGKKERK
jgi:hypothetical protein